jgi:hypothetical protein
MARSGSSRHGAWLSFTTCTLPQRSQVLRRNHEGKAQNGSASASAAVGSGSLPYFAHVAQGPCSWFAQYAVQRA